MDNAWHKIVLSLLLFALGATAILGLITLMLYTPEFFK